MLKHNMLYATPQKPATFICAGRVKFAIQMLFCCTSTCTQVPETFHSKLWPLTMFRLMKHFAVIVTAALLSYSSCRALFKQLSNRTTL